MVHFPSISVTYAVGEGSDVDEARIVRRDDACHRANLNTDLHSRSVIDVHDSLKKFNQAPYDTAVKLDEY